MKRMGNMVRGSGVLTMIALVLVAIRVGCVLVLALLVALAPFALAAYALPHTQDIARLWWRAFTALLVVQPVQAALTGLGIAIAANASVLGLGAATLVSALFVLALLYVLVRVPFAALGWAARPTPAVHALRELVLVGR